MKRTLLFLTAMTALCSVAVAQDDAAFAGWMKAAAATSGSLRKNLEARNSDGATADARVLQELFTKVRGYWSAKSVEDATRLATTASESYGEAAAVVAADKFEEAVASAKKAGGTCNGCHALHRDRQPDGSSKIK